MSFWLYPPDPGSVLEAPTVTAPMTGRTVSATTTGSISPKSSGLGEKFFPGRTRLRNENEKKKKTAKVMPPGRGRISFYNNGDAVMVRPDFRAEDLERTKLVVTEGAWLRAMRKLFTGRPTAKPRAVTQVPQGSAVATGFVRSRAPISPSRVSSRNPVVDKQTGKPSYNPGTIPMDKEGNMVPDADYEKVGSGIHPDAWGKDAPPTTTTLTGEPQTPGATKPKPELAKAATASPARSLGSSSMKDMPSRSSLKSTSNSSSAFVRSRTPRNDGIRPED